MKKIIVFALLCAAIPFVHAEEAAPAPGVVQLFSCNLNPGQNQDDVWSVLEALRDNVAEPRPPGFSIFLWLPFRGASNYDYIWGATATDLVEMAEGLTNYMNSANAATLGARFAALNESCDSVILLSEQMQAGAIGQTAGRDQDALTETFLCRVNAGATMADVRSAAAFWQEQMGKIDSSELESYDAYLLTPYRGGTGEAQFGWVGNYRDLVTWGKAGQAYNASKAGQAADARFEKVSTCRSALWNGYWVLPPAG